jgi:hypothetical protein
MSILHGLGRAALDQDRLDEARTRFEEAQDIARQFGDGTSRSTILDSFACLAAARQQHPRALRIAAAAAAARARLGSALAPSWGHLNEPWLALARSALGAEAVADALAAGRAMNLEQAVTYALEGDGS